MDQILFLFSVEYNIIRLKPEIEDRLFDFSLKSLRLIIHPALQSYFTERSDCLWPTGGPQNSGAPCPITCFQ